MLRFSKNAVGFTFWFRNVFPYRDERDKGILKFSSALNPPPLRPPRAPYFSAHPIKFEYPRDYRGAAVFRSTDGNSFSLLISAPSGSLERGKSSTASKANAMVLVNDKWNCAFWRSRSSLAKMRFFSRSVLSLAGNMTSLGGPMMIANATSIYVANATLFANSTADVKSLQQTLAYAWIVFLSALLGCIIITTVLGKLTIYHYLCCWIFTEFRAYWWEIWGQICRNLQIFLFKKKRVRIKNGPLTKILNLSTKVVPKLVLILSRRTCNPIYQNYDEAHVYSIALPFQEARAGVCTSSRSQVTADFVKTIVFTPSNIILTLQSRAFDGFFLEIPSICS